MTRTADMKRDHPFHRRPDGRPLPMDHHLSVHRGTWRFRTTVPQGKGLVGKPLFIPLHTKHFETACMMRDKLITILKNTDNLCRPVLLDTNSLSSTDEQPAA